MLKPGTYLTHIVLLCFCLLAILGMSNDSQPSITIEDDSLIVSPEIFGISSDNNLDMKLVAVNKIDDFTWPIDPRIPGDAYYFLTDEMDYFTSNEAVLKLTSNPDSFFITTAISLEYTAFLEYVNVAFGSRSWAYVTEDISPSSLDDSVYETTAFMKIPITVLRIVPLDENAEWKLIVNINRYLEKEGWLIVSYELSKYKEIDRLLYLTEWN